MVYTKLSVIVLTVLMFSCQQSAVRDNNTASVSNELSVSETVIKVPVEQVEEVLTPVSFEKEVVSGDEISKVRIHNENLDANIYTFDEGYSFLKYKDSYFSLEFNFTYDTDFESAIDDIHLFESEKHLRHYLLLPSYTEEFSTYQVLYLENDMVIERGIHTTSMEEFEKALSAKGGELIFINEKGDDVQISMSIGETTILLDNVYDSEEANIKELEESDLERMNTL